MQDRWKAFVLLLLLPRASAAQTAWTWQNNVESAHKKQQRATKEGSGGWLKDQEDEGESGLTEGIIIQRCALISEAPAFCRNMRREESQCLCLQQILWRRTLRPLSKGSFPTFFIVFLSPFTSCMCVWELSALGVLLSGSLVLFLDSSDRLRWAVGIRRPAKDRKASGILWQVDRGEEELCNCYEKVLSFLN